MPTTFDIIRTGDRFRFLDATTVPAPICEKTGPNTYRTPVGGNLRVLGDTEAIWVEWIDPKKPAPEPKAPRYTVEAGRGILRDGKLIGRISGSSRHGEYISPTDLDSLTRRIADLLNQHGEDPYAHCAGEEEAEAHNEAREC